MLCLEEGRKRKLASYLAKFRFTEWSQYSERELILLLKLAIFFFSVNGFISHREFRKPVIPKQKALVQILFIDQ